MSRRATGFGSSRSSGSCRLRPRVKQRPQLFGAEFDGPMEGHHPLMPLGLHHYDLHVWLFKDNPVGLFRPTNPAVKCGAYPFSFSQHPPKLVSHQ